MGGTLDMVAGNGAAPSTSFGTGTVELRRSVIRTLLGPEGPGRSEGGSRDPRAAVLKLRASTEPDQMAVSGEHRP